MREQHGVRGGHARVYRVLSHVPVPGLGDLPPVVAGSLCCHTCWLGGSGARGLRGAIGAGIVAGRWHSRLPSRSAWHPGPCWGRGSGWGGRDGEARRGVRGQHALQTGRCSPGAGAEERQRRGWARLSCEGSAAPACSRFLQARPPLSPSSFPLRAAPAELIPPPPPHPRPLPGPWALEAAPPFDVRSPLGSRANLRPAPDEGEDIWSPWFCSPDLHAPHPNRVHIPFAQRPVSHPQDPVAHACPAPDPTRVPRRLPHDLLHATTRSRPHEHAAAPSTRYGCRPDPSPKSRRPSIYGREI